MTESEFINNWWARTFPNKDLPTAETSVTFGLAIALVTAFHGAHPAAAMTGPTAKHWLESEWSRKFGSRSRSGGLTVAELEELLVQLRQSNDARCPPRAQAQGRS